LARKILITSALPYVNNVPHLGTIIGCVLSADVFARYCRAKGYETLYICGTDEHGTATETKALEEGLTPKEICDKYFAIHERVYSWFGCSFDAFGRTSNEVHREVTQSIFKRLYENGYIKKGELEQTYCPKCDKFLADRFVEGTCPHCGYERARGDQCESCSKLLNPVELINSKCKVCSSKPVVRKSNHLFLDLPKIGPELRLWTVTAASEGFWPQNAKTITEAWFKEGLKERCITRDLKWGIPVPLQGYENKVFYVWFDAPIGYISITKSAFPDTWGDWWLSKEAKLYQFMAKDNIPFHTILFPATMLGANDGWNMLHHIDSTEFLNYEGGKFSKSAGTGVFGDDAMSSGIPADVWRYYLLSNRPEAADYYFSWKEFQEKNNNELLANLGNFVNRTLTFTSRYFEGNVPHVALTEADDNLVVKVEALVDNINRYMDAVQEREALHDIMQICRLGNQYFQENAPWNLVKPESGEEANRRCGTVINVCCNLVNTIAVLIEPFLPFTAAEIFRQLNSKSEGSGYELAFRLTQGHKIGEPKALFRKIEDSDVAGFRERFAGKKEVPKSAAAAPGGLTEFPLDLRIAKVESVSNHPDAEKLYVLQINLAKEKRQLVAGLRAYIRPEELLGRNIIVVCNLKPAKLRGIESNGMLLAADDGKNVVLLQSNGSEPGDEVTVEGIPNVPKFSQLSIDEFAKITLTVDENGGVVCTNFGRKLKAPAEYVTAKIGKGAKIR
jgi:methionyl-tRNA synthetase